MGLVILQPGQKLDSLAHVPGEFADWVLVGMGLTTDQAETLYPHRQDAYPEQADAIVITGSSAMVTDGDDWILEGSQWLKSKSEEGIPVLGICFGHQWLGEALGGKVSANPRGTEVGSVEIRLTQAAEKDPLLGELPGSFHLPVSHRQSVVELPPGAIHLASSDLELHQAFRVGDQTWGVQFHPEFSAEITRGYLDYHAETVLDAGRDPAQLKNAVSENTLGPQILRRFAEIAGLAG